MKKEPFLRDASSGNVRDKDLRADFLATGLWERHRVAFLITAFWMLTHPLVSTATQAMSLPCVPLSRRRRQHRSAVRRWLGASHPWYANWTGFSTESFAFRLPNFYLICNKMGKFLTTICNKLSMRRNCSALIVPGIKPANFTAFLHLHR